MVIKTAVKTKRPGLPSKRPFGSVYELAKQSLQYYGYYEDIKKYDPGYYVEKYTYKPHKRIAGKLGQILHKSKTKSRIPSINRQFDKKRCEQHARFIGYCN